MKNATSLGKDFFKGNDSRRFETSPAMAELMKNPKIASVLLDRLRQKEFFEAMTRHVDKSGELDSDTLREILGGLYSENSRISKGSVERIADALLTENRGPKYFTYPEPEEKTGVGEPGHESTMTEKKTFLGRIFG